MAKQTKTNALRILDAAGVFYREHLYSPDGGIDGQSVARSLGEDPQQVFKTLVARGASRALYVFVVPVVGTLNLKKAAKACGEKSVEMIPQKELLPNTGYVHGGCSPVGMKKVYPTYLDETAQLFDTICVSAGRIGAQAELSPEDLLRVTGAEYAPLAD